MPLVWWCANHSKKQVPYNHGQSWKEREWDIDVADRDILVGTAAVAATDRVTR